MADFGSPVVQPPAPTSPLQSLSEMMGIQQRRIGIQQQQQSLQTGQYLQQSSKARAQMEQVDAQKQQISMNEQQALGKLDMSKYFPNGMADPDAYLKDAAPLAPFSGLATERAKQLLDVKNAQITTQSAAQKLNEDQRRDITNNLRMAAETAKEPLDVIKFAENQKKINPGAAETWDAVLQPILKPGVTMEQVKGMLHTQNAAVQGIDKPIPGTMTGKSGNVVGTTQSPVSGQLDAAPGQGVTPGLSPTDKVPYKIAVASGTERAAGGASADVKASSGVVDSLRDARGNIDLTKRIDQLAEVVRPGAVPEAISKGLGALGLQDVNQARTELDKDIGRLRGGLSGRAGSDSRAATALEGLPTGTSPTDTIHQAMDVNRGIARQDLALGKLREKSAKTTGGQMDGFQGDYAHAVSAASPLMHEYHALSDADKVAFYKRNFKTKEQARAFRDQAESVKRMSPDVIGK